MRPIRKECPHCKGACILYNYTTGKKQKCLVCGGAGWVYDYSNYKYWNKKQEKK